MPADTLWGEWASCHGALRQGHLWRRDPTEGICNKCWSPIIWVLTENGKNMPLDPETSAYGRFSFTGEVIDRKPVVHYQKDDEPISGELLYKSHFATCRGSEEDTRPPVDEYERFM